MNDYGRQQTELESVTGESLDQLKRSVNQFFNSSEAKPRGAVVDVAACHRALDVILDWHNRRQKRRSCAGDRGRR
ncbi:MAG: hypothetical protein ABSA80_10180 [Terriglobales bacterium]|jgi:hypothetical protein